MIKRIDTHAHCRDGNQAYKTTIREVFDIAKNRCGIYTIFDNPNKGLPGMEKNMAVTEEKHVDYFVRLAENQGCSEGYYLLIGGTENPDQIRHAAAVATNHPKVPGIKTFTTGGGIITIGSESGRKMFYRTLVSVGYKGVTIWHLEDESLFDMSRWDPERPWTWNIARPKPAEFNSIDSTLRIAKDAGFEGIFYAYHVTCPESVQVIEHYRKICDFPIVCGATPHGLLITTDDMEGREGLRYKANPPVRDPSTVKGLRKELKEGKIDFIESDHAPHTYEEKFLLGEKCLSGYTSYDSYPDLYD